MSQNAKVIKPKKKFNWSQVWYYIRSLWSNQVCLECGITKKWYYAVIIALVAVLTSMIPLTVHTATASGSSFISSTTIYNYDEGFYSFLEDMNKNGYDITFDNQNYTSSLKGKTTTASNNYLLYEHKYVADDGHATSRTDFQVYYFDSSVNYSTTSSIITTLNVNSTSGRDCSYIIFGYDYFSSALYKPGTYNSSTGGVSGDYKNLIESDVKLSNFYATSESTHIANSKKSLDNFKGFLDRVYIDNRTSLTWLQTGIILAVNTSLTLLMGLVLFLMTRGKNNPNRDLKFQQCFNIAYWCTLSPAILSLILGFMFSGYEIMLFVILYGFRVMWLSMKSLQPGVSNRK